MTAPADTPLHCRHFGACGGCTRLDQPIATQLAAKQRRATELLAPFLAGVAVDAPLPPRTPRHDRTSILYPARWQHGRLELGIYRPGSHDVEPIADCRIQHKALTRLAVAVAEALRALGVPAYDETTGRGLVRALRARLLPGSNELLFGLVVTRLGFSERERLARDLWALAQGRRDEQGRAIVATGLVLNENAAPGNVLLGPRSEVLRGEGFHTDTVAGLRLRVSFASFYQQNRHADAILFRPALALLGDVAGLRVVDGYGGVGAFGLRLLRQGARQVAIVESSPSACADARANLEQNGCADRGEVLEQAFGAAPLPPCELMVLDPPRAGLMEAGAAAVLAAAPPRVLLVSCALESLARDLARLGAAYRVAAVRLCDLFPHTEHVEAVTLLLRR
ncbi:MAG: class I SAM-dependent RNA methyltransferase [Planctomycetes bacterium]|nr:class I SAM-dependent RNA methyltransferase [Planctomycetota bacterium]